MATLMPEGSRDSGTCPACFKIMEFFRKVQSFSDIVHEERRLGSISEVTSMPCPHSESIQVLWDSGKPMDLNVSDTWTVALYSCPSDIAFYFRGPGPKSYFFRTFSLMAKPDQIGHTGESRVIDAEWIDHAVPQLWYDTCLQEHGAKCEKPLWMAAQHGSIFRSFQILDSFIHLGLYDLSPNYCHTSRTVAATIFITHDLPRTVRYAIRTTKLLGETYLWVDSLCIVQDDAVSLKHNLNNMHHIYAGSTLCLVAFAGLDANHGLRGLEGISAPRAVEQLVLPVAGQEAVMWYNTPRATFDSLREVSTEIGKRYNERGWTFQEFIFAKRRLIFTEGPVSWICPCATYPSLSRVVSEFNVRYFTFWEDILKAFLGIQNHLHRNFVGLNHGHPDMFFDISLLWEPELEVSRRGSPHDAPTEERYMPTWSWMGWHGCLEFLHDDEYEWNWAPKNGIVEPVAQWFAFQQSASSMRPITCDWHKYKMLARADAFCIPDGWTRIKDSPDEDFFEIGVALFYYPIPVPSLASPIDPIVQLRFIFAETTRVYFTARKNDTAYYLLEYQYYVTLYTLSGQFAGYMRLY
ncbi:HET-domain-containing protein [Karstenula rhodostoma CBS 690.94]|uniref:HET-domain-containing protein n=1 Tax=Karstenula rhodostoma CBS 690.94 TaxID=1392251 RepID=A0A9P4PJ36_9PLEO|nr:HET-domain-containing protein [Karstenula rhodostoma CBS 690.94]